MNFNSAVIVAGGSSTRFGEGTPKQFQILGGRQILQHSVDTFSGHADIHELVLVLPEIYASTVQARFPDCRVVAGGDSRQASVAKGVAACSPEAGNILVHDAARPLLSSRIITDCLGALKSAAGSAPVMTPADSLIKVQEQGFERVDRDKIRLVQTPQCFHADLLRQALAKGADETDEIGLVLRVFPESKIEFVQGEARNMKITATSDLSLAASYLDNP